MNKALICRHCRALCFGIRWENLTANNTYNNLNHLNHRNSIPKRIRYRFIAILKTAHRYPDRTGGGFFDPVSPLPPSGIKFNKSRYLFNLTPPPVPDDLRKSPGGEITDHPRSGWLEFSAIGRKGKSTSVLLTVPLQPVPSPARAGFVWQEI